MFYIMNAFDFYIIWFSIYIFEILKLLFYCESLLFIRIVIIF